MTKKPTHKHMEEYVIPKLSPEDRAKYRNRRLEEVFKKGYQRERIASIVFQIFFFVCCRYFELTLIQVTSVHLCCLFHLLFLERKQSSAERRIDAEYYEKYLNSPMEEGDTKTRKEIDEICKALLS